MNCSSLHTWDTIVAVSTPAGSSLRAIVRLSGKDAIHIASQVVHLPNRPLLDMSRYGIAEGTFELSPDGSLSPITLLLMRAPSSYTREDVVELQTFGSPVLLRMMVERLIELGARLAEPGEFTKRAFLNGRIDLAQAEAVGKLIHARSEAAQRRAIEELVGGRLHPLRELRRDIVDLCAKVELDIDFSDQDLEIVSADESLKSIKQARLECEELLIGSEETVERKGIPIAIFGRPNVGKSSLMNVLVGSQRAIVSEIPGTTRDVLEADIELDGATFRLIDTAGIREANDALETEGVRRAKAALRSAEIGLFLLDGSMPIDHDDLVASQDVSIPNFLIILNKSDLPSAVSKADVAQHFGSHPVRRISCHSGEGTAELLGELVSLAARGKADASFQSFETSVRRRAALRKAVESLRRAEEIIISEEGSELVALELREALFSIGELTGETASEDILERIFSEFCIGK